MKSNIPIDGYSAKRIIRRKRMNMEEQRKRIGQRIKDARASANLTQVQVSEKTGITQNRLSDYERGAVMPELSSLLRIAPVLGVQVSDLID